MDFIKKIKENLKDPKKKSLTLLGIYAIFFIFVFIILNREDSSTYNYIEETTNTISSYEYIYILNNNDVINQITGTYKKNEETFNYNGLNYIKKEGIIYLNNTQVIDLDFDIDRYKYDNIELLIENSDSKTTYKESSKVVYNINANKYFELLNEVNNCGVIDCTYINVSITIESDEYINHVIIDLSNYYGYKYTVEINYNNINSIE